MIPLALLTFISLQGLASGSPYLGAHHYQQLANPQFYVNPSPLLYHTFPHHQLYSLPPQQYLLPTHHQQYTVTPHHQQYTVPPHHQDNSIPDVEVAEINQFHSDDGQGRVLYGFHGHNQARMEARDPQGRVRGSYSYVDPNGQLVRMDYWDDGSGFQARGNNIPKVTYELPGFTPEVQAAREQHFKLYQQILLSSVHSQPPNKVEEDDYPYVERPDGAVSSPSSQDEDDTVEVGVSDLSNDDLPAFPSYPGPMRAPQNFDTRPVFQYQDEEDLESIALDNPEFRNTGRSGKSLGDSKQESSNQDDMVQKQPAKKDQVSGESQDKQDNKKDETVVQVKDNVKKEDAKIETKKEEVTPEGENGGKHSGFSYNFQYTLGSPSKLQISPNFQKFSSIAASEMSDQRTSIHSVHPLPIRTVTGFAQGPSAVHDAQVTPYQSVQPQTGQMIIKSFPSPAGAVHDAQVPRRSTSIKAEQS